MVKKIIRFLILLVLLAVLVYVGRPKLCAFFYNKGIECYADGRYDQAEEYFQKALKVDPSVVVVHYSLAELYLEQGAKDAAIEQYKQAIELDVNYIPAYRALSHIYLDGKIYKEVHAIIKQLTDISSAGEEVNDLIDEISFDYAVGCVNNGLDSFLAGEKIDAYLLLEKAIEINPKFNFAHYTLAYFYYSEQKYDQARKGLYRAIDVDPNFWPVYRLLGDVYFDERDYEKAVVNYETSLDINSSDSTARNNLSLALMQLERYKEALKYLQEALSLEPGNHRIRYNLANLYRDNLMFKDAAREYQEVILTHPDYPNIHNELGDVYLEQGNKMKAFSEYRKEIEYSQRDLLDNLQDVLLRNNLAYAYNATGEYKKAEKIIKEVIEENPEYQEAFLTLARIQENLGEYDQALDTLDKAGSLSTEKVFINRNIGRLEKMTGAFGNAPFDKPVSFDKIYLKNGRMIEGIIKQETQERIVLDVWMGRSKGAITLDKDDVEDIDKSGRFR